MSRNAKSHKSTGGVLGRQGDMKAPRSSSFRKPKPTKPPAKIARTNGETAAKKPKKDKRELKIVTITPAMATKMLELNQLNRPLKQGHVDRIANQIKEGKWRFNGDTIKIATNHDILDGQHRLWACILADVSIETVVVEGIERDAFATIDTLRATRTFGDTLSLDGVTRNRREIGTALAWLIRWQNGVIPEFKQAKNRIENSDIEAIYAKHAAMTNAVERVRHAKSLISHAILGFLYYVLASRDLELADRFIDTLESPAGVAVNDPFFRFRAWLLQSLENKKRREPVLLIALAFKAWNYAKEGREIEALSWRNQGPTREKFPTLD